MIAQLIIALCGATAIWLSQDARESRRRWACIVGLVAQPAWFWATWTAGQYGIFAVCGLYTWAWWRGFHGYWVPRIIARVRQ